MNNSDFKIAKTNEIVIIILAIILQLDLEGLPGVLLNTTQPPPPQIQCKITVKWQDRKILVL